MMPPFSARIFGMNGGWRPACAPKGTRARAPFLSDRFTRALTDKSYRSKVAFGESPVEARASMRVGFRFGSRKCKLDDGTPVTDAERYRAFDQPNHLGAFCLVPISRDGGAEPGGIGVDNLSLHVAG
jgi:hypothetical protein